MSQTDFVEPCHNGHLAITVPDPEVPPRVKRRRFSSEYKLHILAEAEACTHPGERGVLLCRENERLQKKLQRAETDSPTIISGTKLYQT